MKICDKNNYILEKRYKKAAGKQSDRRAQGIRLRRVCTISRHD